MTKIRNIFKSKPKSDENLSKSKPTFADFRVKSKPTSRKTVSNPKQGAKLTKARFIREDSKWL